MLLAVVEDYLNADDRGGNDEMGSVIIVRLACTKLH